MVFHAKDLRKGRFSKSGHHYLITTVTSNRKPIFRNFQRARILVNTIRSSDEKGYTSTIGFVVMPDHLHWLIVLENGIELSAVIKIVKGNSAYLINKTQKEKIISWQVGFHDHALRKKEDLVSTMRYILENPIRAGLAEHIGDYPHWDCVYL